MSFAPEIYAFPVTNEKTLATITRDARIIASKLGAPTGEASEEAHTEAAAGMTLRDYFAAKAMAALITTQHGGPLPSIETCQDIAGTAYDVANAMIEEREVR